MATPTYSAPVSEVYGESTALATTLAYGDILNTRAINGFQGLQIWCTSEIRFLTTPRIAKVILYDASERTYQDQTSAAVDNDANTEVVLGTMTTSDILYVGAVDTYLGLAVDVGTVNAVVATFDEEYYSSTGLWTNLPATISDGTISGSKTLAQDGLYTWGLPSDWKPTSVNGSVELYFTRFKPSATLTAGTSLDGLITINKGTNYIRWPAASPQEFNYDTDLVGGLQFLAVSATPTVHANWIKYKG